MGKLGENPFYQETLTEFNLWLATGRQPQTRLARLFEKSFWVDPFSLTDDDTSKEQSARLETATQPIKFEKQNLTCACSNISDSILSVLLTNPAPFADSEFDYIRFASRISLDN